MFLNVVLSVYNEILYSVDCFVEIGICCYIYKKKLAFDSKYTRTRKSAGKPYLLYGIKQ